MVKTILKVFFVLKLLNSKTSNADWNSCQPARFSYIVTALELIALNPEYLNNITKGLYADVSEKCSSTPVRVERNIRHAIEIGF